MYLKSICLVGLSLILLSAIKASGQSTSSLYYLCIGSGHYDFNPMYSKDHVFEDYEQLPEAINSSLVMSEIIKNYGHGEGIVLNSSKERLISKDDILSSLETTWEKINADKKPDPLLIIYYCGHGFVDSLIGSQFLLSGNYPRVRNKDNFDERVKENIYALELMFMIMMKQPSMSFKEMDKIFTSNDPMAALGQFLKLVLNINTSSIRCLVLLDCCRNPITNDGLNMKNLQKRYGKQGSEGIAGGFASIVEAVKPLYGNSLSMLHPLIFSGENMNAVSVVAYPPVNLPAIGDEYKKEGIGPICQKTIKIIKKMDKDNQMLTLNRWLSLLTSHSSNEESTPVSSSPINKGDTYPVFHLP